MPQLNPLNTLKQLREKLVQLRRSLAEKLIEPDVLEGTELAGFVQTCQHIEWVDRAMVEEERLAHASRLTEAAQRPVTEKLTRVELLDRETREKQSRMDRTNG